MQGQLHFPSGPRNQATGTPARSPRLLPRGHCCSEPGLILPMSVCVADGLCASPGCASRLPRAPVTRPRPDGRTTHVAVSWGSRDAHGEVPDAAASHRAARWATPRPWAAAVTKDTSALPTCRSLGPRLSGVEHSAAQPAPPSSPELSVFPADALSPLNTHSHPSPSLPPAPTALLSV